MRAAQARLAVDASSAVVGGGITYLRHIIPRLALDGRVELSTILIRKGVNEVASLANKHFKHVVIGGRAGGLFNSEWKGRTGKIDVIYIPTEISLKSYDVPTIMALRSPRLYHCGVWEYPAWWRFRFWLQRLLAMRSLQSATAVVAVSEHVARLGDKELGLDSGKIHVIHHGSPAPAPRTKSQAGAETRNFLFVSTVYRYKNLHRLIDAFSLLPSDASLRVLGGFEESSYQEDCFRRIQRLGLDARVMFAGHAEWHLVRESYAWADVLVWPSYAETFGHPIREAFSFGLPVIAADAASNREIAGGRANYFDPFDVHQLALELKAAYDGRAIFGDPPELPDWDECAARLAALVLSVA